MKNPSDQEASSPADSGATKTAGSDGRGWLHTIGPFLFIPIFALIVVLLFWRNEDPLPPSADMAGNGQEMPSMEAMNQIHETLNRLKANLEANPEDVVAMDSLAIMYSIAGSHDKAKTYYEQHLALEPDNYDVKIGLALTYHNLNDDNKAMALLQEILNKEPNYVFAMHYMAEILDVNHKHDEAKEYWSKIIEVYPNTEMAKVAQERIDAQHEDGE